METELDVPPSKTDAPELSVIIAAYNAAETLPEQLNALTREPPPFGWEVLVCDNGSTDDTADVVREWQTRFPVIRLVDAAARRGPAAARNIGAAHARSPRLAFCDADDRVGEGWLGVVHGALEQHVFVAGSFEFAELNEGIDVPGLWTAQSSGLTRKSYFADFVVAGAGNMGIRKAVFDEVGGFFEGLRTAEDDDLCLRVQLSGYPLEFVPEMVLHVRRRGGLRDLCKQAFSYAGGERRLSYRYADYADMQGAEVRDPAVPAKNDADAGHQTQTRLERSSAMIARAVRKLTTIRRPADLAAVGWRWSWKLGWLLTKEDKSIPRVDPRDARSLRVSN